MINVFHHKTNLKFSKNKTKKIILLTLKEEFFFCREINVIFIDDREIKKMKKKFFQIDKITDVISFRLNEGEKVEGEIYISLNQTKRQAKIYNETFENEVLRLIIHGTLHLIGYDDATQKQKDKMTKKENLYLEKFFYDNRKNI